MVSVQLVDGRGCRLFLCWLVVFSLGRPVVTQATHEVDHRFTIFGTVRNGNAFPGAPMAHERVLVRDATTGRILLQGVTNEQGQFSLTLHVHNDDLGRVLSVQAAGSEQQLTLTFDPDDTKTERRRRVDIVVFR